jgi:hypothetical protein
VVRKRKSGCRWPVRVAPRGWRLRLAAGPAAVDCAGSHALTSSDDRWWDRLTVRRRYVWVERLRRDGLGHAAWFAAISRPGSAPAILHLKYKLQALRLVPSNHMRVDLFSALYPDHHADSPLKYYTQAKSMIRKYQSIDNTSRQSNSAQCDYSRAQA